MAQRPDRLVAFLDGSGGFVRNPAFATLQGLGILDPGLGYRAWLDIVAQPTSQGWIVPDPDHPATLAGRFRRALADYALADLDTQGRSSRLDALISDLRHGCQAVGVPLPEDPKLAHDGLLELLNEPWNPARIPDVAPIQVLDRRGDSGHGPDAARFSNGLIEVDLDDLGNHTDRFLPAAPSAIRAALNRTSRRSGDRERNRARTVRLATILIGTSLCPSPMDDGGPG